MTGLSACDPHETGSAAVVGGSGSPRPRSTTTRRRSSTRSRSRAPPLPPTTCSSARWSTAPSTTTWWLAVAKREDITITQGQIDNLIDTNGGRTKLTADFATRDGLWLPPGQMDELARTSLIQIALGNKLAPGGDANAVGTAVNSYKVKLAKQIDVHVSPRYGAWNPATLEISGSVDDLSTPAVLTPSPAPSAG